MIELPLSMQIFDMRDTHRSGYSLTLPGVMISGVELPVSFEDGKWTVTQTEGDLTWSASHEYKMAALLALIVQRMGFDVQITTVPEDET